MAGWDWGQAGQGAASGAAAGSVGGGWGALIGGAIGGLAGGLSGGGGGSDLPDFWGKSFNSKDIQKMLPTILRTGKKGGQADRLLGSGFAGIQALLDRPGSLPPNIVESLSPALALESERISRDFANLRANTAGGAARSGAPASFAAALDAALGRAEAADQGAARRGMLVEGGKLARADLAQTYDVLNAILAFINSGRGVGAQQVQGAALQQSASFTNQAANQAGLASLLDALRYLPSNSGKTGGNLGVMFPGQNPEGTLRA